MPKTKTNRAAKKRFKAVGSSKSGIKFKRNKAFRRHILTSKTRKTKRNLRAGGYVHEADMVTLAKLLPNG